MEQQNETVQSQSEEITSVAQVSTAQKKLPWIKPLIALLAGVIVVLGTYVAYTYFSTPAVAIVNGKKIAQSELQSNVEMMVKSAGLQGIDTADPAIITEIRTQALTNLINNELLLGAARKAGMSTNEAAIKTAYDALVTEIGGEEALKSRMESVGLSNEILLGNISDRLMVDAYIEAETDIESITVTDSEIDSYLTSIQTDGVTLPPMEEIRPQIEASLIAEKQQNIVNTLIEKLRSEATIEMIE